MVNSQRNVEELLRSDSLYYSTQIDKIIQQVQPKFDRLVKRHMAFHLLFLGLSFFEVILFIAFFGAIVHSSALALSLGVVFLTGFCYLMLRLYLFDKKQRQFQEIREEFACKSQKLIHYEEGDAESHVILSNAYNKWAVALQGREYSYYRPTRWLVFLTPMIERWSHFWFWEDLISFRELLYLAAVGEHIKLVRCSPANLEFHAALANAYLLLSALYASVCKQDYDEEGRLYPSKQVIEAMERKFRRTAKRAIEEFKIMDDYAPDDPWIHVQLAYSYRDLQMPKEEMQEYESILRLRPDDKETLFKLGVLYFQQGHNAKGLKVYESLKRLHYKQAERLIEYYGVYRLN